MRERSRKLLLLARAARRQAAARQAAVADVRHKRRTQEQRLAAAVHIQVRQARVYMPVGYLDPEHDVDVHCGLCASVMQMPSLALLLGNLVSFSRILSHVFIALGVLPRVNWLVHT